MVAGVGFEPTTFGLWARRAATEEESSALARFFGYRKEKIEPRLYGLKYERGLHEQLQGVKGKLKQGQPVAGKITKSGEQGKGKGGKGKADKKGEGSESQEQNWEFHELLPSDFHEKDWLQFGSIV